MIVYKGRETRKKLKIVFFQKTFLNVLILTIDLTLIMLSTSQSGDEN